VRACERGKAPEQHSVVAWASVEASGEPSAKLSVPFPAGLASIDSFGVDAKG